jgi:hypothetical protein
LSMKAVSTAPRKDSVTRKFFSCINQANKNRILQTAKIVPKLYVRLMSAAGLTARAA